MTSFGETLMGDREDDNAIVSLQASYASDLLPISARKKQILYALKKYSIVVIIGETGSGKSTQIPQILLAGGWCNGSNKIVCTQPRRLAAITLAQRVTREVSMYAKLKEPNPVGYVVRFDNHTYDPIHTKIKYVTDGILVREALVSDPLLLDYSVIIIDEAHERGIMTDVLLGLIKKIRRKRPSLRVVVCSATIDAKAFLDFFCGKKSSNEEQTGCIISVDGRQHPIDIFYANQAVRDYLISCVDTVMRIHEKEDRGDILVFLPTAEEIDHAIKMTDERIYKSDVRGTSGDMKKRKRTSQASVVCLPLYGSLPQTLQARIFKIDQNANRQRRIIFATNIAETSVTVPNVRFVVDAGFVKAPFFDPCKGLERLVIAPISKASAKQRAGRAGRCSPGKCYRLYTEKFYSESLDAASSPEVLRTNLSSFVLTLKALGIDDLMTFDLMSPPSRDSIIHALESLYALGALDDSCALTEAGNKMVEFPTNDPRLAKMLLVSLHMKCSEEILTIASIMQVREIFVRPRTSQQRADFDAAMGDLVDRTGDHATYINLAIDHTELLRDSSFVNIVAIRRALEIKSQLKRFLKNYGQITHYDGVEDRNTIVRKCVCSGWFLNIARISNDGFYYTVKGNQKVKPSPSSSVFSRFGKYSEYIVFGETFDGADGDLEVRFVSAIDGRWLHELAPHYWS